MINTVNTLTNIFTAIKGEPYNKNSLVNALKIVEDLQLHDENGIMHEGDLCYTYGAYVDSYSNNIVLYYQSSYCNVYIRVGNTDDNSDSVVNIFDKVKWVRSQEQLKDKNWCHKTKQEIEEHLRNTENYYKLTNVLLN